jgi:hypothetical protein
MDFDKYSIILKSECLNDEHNKLLKACYRADLIDSRKWLSRIDELKINIVLNENKLCLFYENNQFDEFGCYVGNEVKLCEMKTVLDHLKLTPILNRNHLPSPFDFRNQFKALKYLHEHINYGDNENPQALIAGDMESLIDLITDSLLTYKTTGWSEQFNKMILKVGKSSFSIALKHVSAPQMNLNFLMPQHLGLATIISERKEFMSSQLQNVKYLVADVRSFLFDFQNSKFDRIIEILKAIGHGNLSKVDEEKLKFLQKCHLNSELGIIHKLNELNIGVSLLLTK